MKKYEINTLLKLKKECPKISTDLLDLQRVIITNIENIIGTNQADTISGNDGKNILRNGWKRYYFWNCWK